MDAIDETMTRVYGAPAHEKWTAPEATQLAAARKAGFTRERIVAALEGLHRETFNRGQPLHALLEPGKLATGLRGAASSAPDYTKKPDFLG